MYKLKTDQQLQVSSMSETQIAWFAGLLEGEGTFGLDARSAKRYVRSTSPPASYIKIAMTDEDVINKAAKMVGKNVNYPKRATTSGKQVYILGIGDRASLRFILPRLLPYLGERRGAKAQLAINALNNHTEWVASGGLSEMAKEGPKAKKLIQEAEKLSMELGSEELDLEELGSEELFE